MSAAGHPWGSGRAGRHPPLPPESYCGARVQNYPTLYQHLCIIPSKVMKQVIDRLLLATLEGLHHLRVLQHLME